MSWHIRRINYDRSGAKKPSNPHHSPKIPESAVDDIRARRAAGESWVSIARDYSVAATTVRYFMIRQERKTHERDCR